MSDQTAESRELTYPSRCYLIGGYMVLALLVASVGIVVVHSNILPVTSALLRAHLICGLFGAVGASIASIRKYYRALITEATEHASGQLVSRTNWSWGWIFYYLSRPVLGSVLGALTFTLSFVGVSVLSESITVKISTEGRYLLYGLSFMSGFAVSHVLDRLNAVSKQVFKAHSEEV